MLVILRACVKDIEKSLSRIADLENAGHIPAAVAVVRCAPHSTQSIVIENLESFLAQLVCSEDVRHGIHLEELPDNLRSEGVTGAPRTERKLVPLRIGVTPHEICHGAFVWYFSKPVDDFNLIDGVYRRGEAAMHAKDLIVNYNGQRQEVEHVSKVMPNVGVAIFPGALGVEAIGLGNASRLVIAPDEMDAMRVAQFKTNEEGYCFDREETAVDVVS
jgi:hypothetical protein